MLGNKFTAGIELLFISIFVLSKALMIHAISSWTFVYSTCPLILSSELNTDVSSIIPPVVCAALSQMKQHWVPSIKIELYHPSMMCMAAASQWLVAMPHNFTWQWPTSHCSSCFKQRYQNKQSTEAGHQKGEPLTSIFSFLLLVNNANGFRWFRWSCMAHVQIVSARQLATTDYHM